MVIDSALNADETLPTLRERSFRTMSAPSAEAEQTRRLRRRVFEAARPQNTAHVIAEGSSSPQRTPAVTFVASPLPPRSSMTQRQQATLVLQRTLGNSAVSRLIEKETAPVQRLPDLSAGVDWLQDLFGMNKGPVAAPPPKDIKFTIAADKEAEWWTPEWYEQFNVGHSWIMVEMANGSRDSYGFWPANLGSGGGFNPSRPWQDVDGEVRQPDSAHSPTAKQTVNIDATQFAEGVKYASGKVSAKYNLLRYNCTTFAREMFEKATGLSAPFGGLLIDDPNDLADSIAMGNAQHGLDPKEGPLPSKKAKP